MNARQKRILEEAVKNQLKNEKVLTGGGRYQNKRKVGGMASGAKLKASK